MKESIFKPMSMAEIRLQAASLNCEVVVAADNELQFDLDSDEAVSAFWMFLNWKLIAHWPELAAYQYCGDCEVYKTWKSKSGNTHIVLTLPESFSIPERIAMQAMGGSDHGREFAALMCHLAGSPHPILLFKPLPKKLEANNATT